MKPTASALSRGPARLVLALVALQLAAAGVFTLRESVRWIVSGIHTAGDGPAAARRRAGGAPYEDAMEGIRRRVPATGSYLALDADPQGRGELVWIRYDLAPRTGEYLGKLRDGKLVPGPALPPDLPEWTVVSHGPDRPPALEPTRALLARLPR